MIKQPKELLAEFYFKPFYLSYSGLNKLLYSPSLFYKHYILQQREDKIDSYLIDGKVIHCLLLDDGSFDTQFILLPSTLPTGNTRLVVDKIYERVKEAPGLFENYTVEITDVLKEINLHQKLKTDAQRIEKIVNDETKSYFEFLKIKGDKNLIDEDTLKRCHESVNAVKQDVRSAELLGLFTNEMQNVNVLNEKLLFAETDKLFGLKGVVDNIYVDHDNKIIKVNDLKTSGKTISEFKDTIEFYNYWAQAAIYIRLVTFLYDELINNSKYDIQFNFIVIDKYLQVYPFEVSKETMNGWQLRLEANLNEAEWHYKEKNYILPYEFATNKVIL